MQDLCVAVARKRLVESVQYVVGGFPRGEMLKALVQGHLAVVNR